MWSAWIVAGRNVGNPHSTYKSLLELNMYQCKWFDPEELVEPHVFEELRDQQWRIWAQFDEWFLMGLDLLRDDLGESIIINDYSLGGHLDHQGKHAIWTRCGLRTYPALPGESKWGMHFRGAAGDLHTRHRTAEEVRQHILSHADQYIKYFNRLEAGIPWCHADKCNYLDGKHIHLIHP